MKNTMARTTEPQDKKPQDENQRSVVITLLSIVLLVFIFTLPLHCGMLYSCPRPLENVLDKIGCHVMGVKRRGMCSYIAHKHYERQDWERARTYFEIDAQQEFDKAQNYLGDMYYHGKGGGKPDMAMGGAPSADKLDATLAAVPAWVKEQLA